ncbi:MAG: anti-sigma factor [Elainella sp. C42_A2020_010]|nr:anti-sigma factor [Elainella sp. C42_A2020_010]
MTRSARPDNWQDLIAGYALGNLSPEEAEALQQLLSEHPELAEEVNRLQEVLALIPYDVPEHDPPAHLREAILAAAQADEPLPRLFDPTHAGLQPDKSEPPQPIKPRPAIHWWGLGGAVAAAALLALGLENQRLRQEVETNRPIVAALQQPDARIYALEGTENAVGASGSIVITPQQQQVLVVAQNLPPLPQGQAYRLWAMPKNSKNPAYCGQFNTGTNGTVSTLWSISEARCQTAPSQLLITAESATAPPVPQGELVMKSRG